jgi:protein-S-isoprenylcysteine O-methyltransferase Ste14
MTNERPFQIALCVMYTCYTLIRMHYRRMNADPHPTASTPQERADACLLRALIPYEVVTMFLYVFAGRWMAWARLPLPAWARWAGAVPGLIALRLFAWAHRSLGRNYSKWLHIRREHTLVTHGPYRWVRHPMYTAFYLIHIAALLLSANWFLGLTWLGGLILLLATRVPREEAMLIAAFGAAYREYMGRTGRFVPRLWHSPPGRRGTTESPAPE